MLFLIDVGVSGLEMELICGSGCCFDVDVAVAVDGWG